MKNEVVVLLLGANEGAYALASAFGGEYDIPTFVMDESIPNAFEASAFVKGTLSVPGIAYRGLLLRALSDFYEAHTAKSLLLIPTTAEYVARVLEEREVLERMFLLPLKKCADFENLCFAPNALLLFYVGRKGSVRTVYGEVAARTDAGKPLAVITKPTPKALLSQLSTDVPHFSLYAVNEEGRCIPFGEDGALSPFVFFPSAADLSLAEWILDDYVTCEDVGEDGDTPEGVFTLFGFCKTKKHLLPMKKTLARQHRRRGLSLSLYPARYETRRPFARRHLCRFYRENWQKKTKTKK